MTRAMKKAWSMMPACDDLMRLGEYEPTRDGRTLKGVCLDLGEDGTGGRTKSYLDASDCLRLAAALMAAAAWLKMPGETAEEDNA
jgi:hypothetical protein